MRNFFIYGSAEVADMDSHQGDQANRCALTSGDRLPYNKIRYMTGGNFPYLAGEVWIITSLPPGTPCQSA